MGIPTGELGCRRPKDANPAGDPPRRARARKGEATMNSRLYKVRKALKMSQVEFGREIGVSGAAISRIEKGERGLTEQMLKSVCREYHVRREWLTEGTGEMFRWDKSDLLERIDALLKTQGNPAQRLFRAFVEMRDDEWAALRRFIHRLAASDPGAVDFQAAGR